MTWFKVDDGFESHPKVLALYDGPCPADAIALWTLAGSWCGAKLTDGAVPRGYVARSPHRAGAAELVRVGLWFETPDGFQFHQWLDKNPSREQVLAGREKTKERQAKWYANQQKTRDPNAVRSDVRDAVRNGVSNDAADSVTNSDLTGAPDPDPVTNSLTDKNSYPAAAEPSYAHASARESGGGGRSEPDALRGSRWLHEALGGHHAYDYGPRSKHTHALTLLARKPATELAAARAALERERMKPGVLDWLTPQHVIDHWHLYGKGKAPGKGAANGGGRRSGPSRVPTPEEYAKAREEKAPWET